MAKLPTLGLLLLACSLSLTTASCGPSGAAAKAAKAPELEVKGQAKCGVSKSHETPLVIEWPDDARVRLERAMAGRLVAVRYEGCDMQVLRGCTVKEGAYRYAPVTPKRSQVAIRDEDELYAKLPVGAVGLEGKLKQAGQLTVDMLMVGRFESDGRPVERSSLEGACQGATHVVTGLTVGAFHFFAGASASVSGSVDAVVASGGARSGATRETLNQDGNHQACEKSAAGDTTPPYGCSAPMVIEVTKLADERVVAPLPAPEGAPGGGPRPYSTPPPYDGAPPQAPQGPQPAAYAEPPVSPSSPFGKPTPARTAVATVGGVGLAVAVSGALGVAAARSTIDSNCDANKVCTQKGIDAVRSYKTFAWTANAGLGVVVAAAVTYLLLPNRRDGGATTAISAQPLPGGGTLQLGRSF